MFELRWNSQWLNISTTVSSLTDFCIIYFVVWSYADFLKRVNQCFLLVLNNEPILLLLIKWEICVYESVRSPLIMIGKMIHFRNSREYPPQTAADEKSCTSWLPRMFHETINHQQVTTPQTARWVQPVSLRNTPTWPQCVSFCWWGIWLAPC